MQIVTERKRCCAVFKDVNINQDGVEDLLPENGVPKHIVVCA